MEEKITIGNKEYIFREFMYEDILNLEGIGKKDMAKEMIKLSTGIADEEFSKLTLKEGIQLQNKINELNELDVSNFQLPTEKNE